VIFAFFSAEEKGLIGSREYVARPPFPIDRTVANLNMDMIGRNDRGKINAVGKLQNPSLFDIAARAGKSPEVGVKVQDEGNEFFNRSDHYNFYKNGVPFLFFFSGLHDDYHRITDTPDKVDEKKISQVARLVFLTSYELATTDVRPKLKGE
jgi:Zn-dependent M28 family amino/carboxypeptidase